MLHSVPFFSRDNNKVVAEQTFFSFIAYMSCRPATSFSLLFVSQSQKMTLVGCANLLIHLSVCPSVSHLSGFYSDPPEGVPTH